MSLLIHKLIMGIRVLTSLEMWRIVVSELLSGRGDGKNFPRPKIQTLEDDAFPGFRLIEVAGRRYWEPALMDLNGLAAIHSEVFEATHPHYYEYEACRVRSGDVVIDAGASEGFFTRFALERGARVVAVEPWSVQVEALRRTFATEIAEGRVWVEQVALSDREGEATLQVNPCCPWAGTMGTGDQVSVQETVRQWTLIQLIERTWGRCDFLKMDVEGAELVILPAAQGVLRDLRPRLSVAVYHQTSGYYRIMRMVKSLGVGYRTTGKGIQRRGFMMVPMLLHAWPVDRGEING